MSEGSCTKLFQIKTILISFRNEIICIKTSRLVHRTYVTLDSCYVGKLELFPGNQSETLFVTSVYIETVSSCHKSVKCFTDMGQLETVYFVTSLYLETVTSVYFETVSSCPSLWNVSQIWGNMKLFPLFLHCTLKWLLQCILKWFQVAQVCEMFHRYGATWNCFLCYFIVPWNDYFSISWNGFELPKPVKCFTDMGHRETVSFVPSLYIETVTSDILKRFQVAPSVWNVSQIWGNLKLFPLFLQRTSKRLKIIERTLDSWLKFV